MRKIIGFLTDRPFLLLLLFLLIAYFPVFLPFFHIKNDLVTQNLPTRFVISESLYSGYFPWWNPYINFGIPQYGDMNDGYWNPFLWLIARTSGYGIWAITLEEMAYILIGGWGIYLVCKDNLVSVITALIAAMSYMSCGFVIGHLQHFCWITGTAFFPYVLLYFTRVHRSPVVKNFILGGLSIFLFTASTHPGLVIGALYFFLFLTAAVYWLRNDVQHSFYHSRYWQTNLIFLLSGLIFSLVVIVSNVDVLQHISRGSKVSMDQALMHPTTFPSYLSLLFPLAVQKWDALFRTDISMRNTYIGLLLLIGFIGFCMHAGKKVLFATCLVLLFYILLSSGGRSKTIAYHVLPFTGYVRLNGEFNYFALLILILAGAVGLEMYGPDRDRSKEAEKILRFFKWIFLSSGIIAMSFMLLTDRSLLHASYTAPYATRQQIKWLVDNLSFWDMVFLMSGIQSLTLACIRKYGNSKFGLITTIAAHLAVTSWLILPFTGLGMASKASRQALISQFPKGIHAPEQTALKATKYLDSSYTKDLVLLGSYTKKIGYVKEEFYPVELRTAELFFHDPALFSFIQQQSYLFLSLDTSIGAATTFDSSLIRIRQFGPGLLHASIDNKGYRYLTFLQNDYPFWKVYIDGLPAPHFTGFKTFITIPLRQGRQDIVVRFDPVPVRTALCIHLALLLSGLILLCIPRISQQNIFGAGRQPATS